MGTFTAPPPPPPPRPLGGPSFNSQAWPTQMMEGRADPADPPQQAAPAPQPSSSGKAPCAFFLKTGTCAYGDKYAPHPLAPCLSNMVHLGSELSPGLAAILTGPARSTSSSRGQMSLCEQRASGYVSCLSVALLKCFRLCKAINVETPSISPCPIKLGKILPRVEKVPSDLHLQHPCTAAFSHLLNHYNGFRNPCTQLLSLQQLYTRVFDLFSSGSSIQASLWQFFLWV